MTKRDIGPFNPKDLPEGNGSGYPEPWKTEASKRYGRLLGNHAGLTKYGVVMTRVEPGGRSSQRHAHSHQEEFVIVMEGEITLHDNSGKQLMRAGECVGFPAGTGNAHTFINESDEDAVFIVIGDRPQGDSVDYPDIDMKAEAGSDGRYRFFRKNGEAY